MSNLQKGVAIVPVLVIVGFLGIVSASAYFYFRTPQDNEAVLQLKLAQAKAKLQAKKVKQVTVEEEFAKTYSIYSILRAQYTRAEVVIEAVGEVVSDPALTAKNTKTKKDIDTKYAKIQELIDVWKSKIDPTNAPNITVGTLNTFKKDAETIRTLIQALDKTVDGLTPDTSDLTQAQIDAYEEQLAQALIEINNTITAVTSAVTVATQDPPFPPVNPVTSEQVQQAQDEVAQAQAEVDAVQAEINAANSQPTTPPPPTTSPSPQTTPPPPPGISPVPPVPPPPPTPIPNPSPGPDYSQGEGMYPYNSIIITPPTPPLIQGSNTN